MSEHDEPQAPPGFGLLSTVDANLPVELADGQRVTLPGGLTLGSVDSAGVRWRIRDIRGWDGTYSRGSVTAREYGHGSWADPAYLGDRVVRVDGTAYAPTRAVLRDAETRLTTAVPLDQLARVDVAQHGVTRYAMMRQSGELVWRPQGAGIADWTVLLVAPDPRRLSVNTWQLSTALPTSVGGLTFPATFPLRWRGATTTGRVLATNRGNIAGPARLRINGPVQFPTVRHAQLGRTLVFELNIAAGQHLIVDLDTHTVLLNGTASRRGRTHGRWFTIEPGLNTLHFNASQPSESARLIVTWQDAWK